MGDPASVRFDIGDYAGARAAALEALATSPDDPDLLRIAGRAGVEVGAADAVAQLRRVTELRPDDAAAWRDLGDALATEGETEEANAAFARAVELDPADESSLTALGHTAFQAGRREDAVSYLEQAAAGRGASTAAISLVDMYRSLGQLDAALAAAVMVAEADPSATALLDVAELSLQTGALDEAAAAFARVREIDELPDHDVYALHGMIAAELARDGHERALALAHEAAALDRYGRSALVVAHLEAADGGPSRADVDAALAASLAEHRRAHADDHLSPPEELHG